MSDLSNALEKDATALYSITRELTNTVLNGEIAELSKTYFKRAAFAVGTAGLVGGGIWLYTKVKSPENQGITLIPQ
jgi:hypothetical protein